jgi:hypothetical protein
MDWSLGSQFGRITEKQIGLISRSQTSRSGPICWRDLRTADRLNG